MGKPRTTPSDLDHGHCHHPSLCNDQAWQGGWPQGPASFAHTSSHIGAWHTPSPASPPECRQQPLFPLYSAAQSREAGPGGLKSCLEPCSRALGNEGNQSHFLSAQAAPGTWPNIAHTIRQNSAAALHCRPATLPLHRWGSGGPGRGHPPHKSHSWEAVNFRSSTDPPVLPPADLDSSWVWHPRAESRSPESEVQGGVKNTGATVLPGLWSPLGCSGGLPAPEFCCSNPGLGEVALPLWVGLRCLHQKNRKTPSTMNPGPGSLRRAVG